MVPLPPPGKAIVTFARPKKLSSACGVCNGPSRTPVPTKSGVSPEKIIVGVCRLSGDASTSQREKMIVRAYRICHLSFVICHLSFIIHFSLFIFFNPKRRFRVLRRICTLLADTEPSSVFCSVFFLQELLLFAELLRAFTDRHLFF